MPWRGPQVEGEVPTLGWIVIDAVESTSGELLSDDARNLLLHMFRLDPDATPGGFFGGWDERGEPTFAFPTFS